MIPQSLRCCNNASKKVGYNNNRYNDGTLSHRDRVSKTWHNGWHKSKKSRLTQDDITGNCGA